jgi:hypothetical protein
LKTKAISSAEVAAIVRNDRGAARRDSSLQHHLVVWIAKRQRLGSKQTIVTVR